MELCHSSCLFDFLDIPPCSFPQHVAWVSLSCTYLFTQSYTYIVFYRSIYFYLLIYKNYAYMYITCIFLNSFSMTLGNDTPRWWRQPGHVTYGQLLFAVSSTSSTQSLRPQALRLLGSRRQLWNPKSTTKLEYIHIFIEREREREREMHIYIYINIYIYTYMI